VTNTRTFCAWLCSNQSGYKSSTKRDICRTKFSQSAAFQAKRFSNRKKWMAGVNLSLSCDVFAIAGPTTIFLRSPVCWTRITQIATKFFRLLQQPLGDGFEVGRVTPCAPFIHGVRRAEDCAAYRCALRFRQIRASTCWPP